MNLSRRLLFFCCHLKSFGLKSSLSHALSTSTSLTQQIAHVARQHKACSKCQGSGIVLLLPSKKVKNAYEFRCSKIKARKSHSRETIQLPEVPRTRKVHCSGCHGAGVVDKSWESPDNHHFGSIEIDFGVIIVGGGIGGCALALALQQRGIKVRVFEKDNSFKERAQGYGLTLQQGIRTLRQLGFPSLAGIGVTSTSHYSYLPDKTLLGAYGRALLNSEPTSEQRVNVHLPRQALRSVLLHALDPGTVVWGHRFTGYKISSTGKVDANFIKSNGENIDPVQINGPVQTCVSGDVLIGGDGIWSSVRAHKLGDEKARYLGVMVILGRGIVSHELTSTDPESCSVFQTLDGTTRVYAMPFSPTTSTEVGETMWQLSFPIDLEGAHRLEALGGDALLEEALLRCGSWHSPIPELLRATKASDVTGYPAYDRPPLSVDLCREGTSRGHGLVSLLGDAAHPMSPFKGQGANQALMDSIQLARCLNAVKCLLNGGSNDMEKPERIKSALMKYEAQMISRSSLKVRASADASQFLHSKAAALAVENVTRASAARAWTDKMIHENDWLLCIGMFTRIL